MPVYKSKKDVENKLRQAREKLKAAREAKPVDPEKVAEALKTCNEIQHVLDRWDAIHS